jgi:hypothetical protein
MLETSPTLRRPPHPAISLYGTSVPRRWAFPGVADKAEERLFGAVADKRGKSSGTKKGASPKAPFTF